VDDPLRTIIGENHMALAEACLVPVTHGGGEERSYSVDDPLCTITAARRGEIALAQPFIVSNMANNVPTSIDDPVGVVTTGAKIAIATPCLVNMKGKSDAADIDNPCPTVCAHAAHVALMEPCLIKYYEGSDAVPIDDPVPTITANYQHVALAQYLVKYNREAPAGDLGDPLDTISTRDRFALVSADALLSMGNGEAVVVGYLDILFRMLLPEELAAAMSFPPHYTFAGSKEDAVRQIGNAVAGNVAKALVATCAAPFAKLHRLSPPKVTP
jgi:DNA (cytosine-5)-methyltransferase 1